MIKKFIIILLTTIITIGLTGCSFISFLTGNETLVMSEIPSNETTLDDTEVDPGTNIGNETETTTKKESDVTISTTKNEQTTKQEETTTKTEESTTKKDIEENKKGNISYKYYTYKADTNVSLPTECLINTKEQWNAIKPTLDKYTCSNMVFNGENALKTYFYIIIPMKDIKSSWVNMVDSVKNNDNLVATILTEKKDAENTTLENRIILLAISRADIPNIDNIKDIEIKQSSYTVK